MKNFKIKADSVSWLCKIALSTVLLGSAQTSATGFSLDAFTSFETNNFQSVTVSPFSPQNTVANDLDPSLDSTVFGNARTLQIEKLDAGLNLNPISFGSAGGQAGFSVPDGTTAKAEIIWDGFDLSNNGQDIEIDGSDVQRSFQVNIQSLNLGNGNGNLDLNFDIRDTSGNVGTLTRNITSNIDTPTSLLFAYRGGFGTESNVVANNVNLQSIDYIRFYTDDENVGDDFTFNFIQSSEEVPFEFSPTLGLILGGSLFGFLKIKKNLQRSKSL